jgi:hypothetical protein
MEREIHRKYLAEKQPESQFKLQRFTESAAPKVSTVRGEEGFALNRKGPK